MADVQGSRKRGQLSDEGNDTDNIARQSSSTKRTRKGNADPKTTGPVKGRKGTGKSRSNVQRPEGKLSKLEPPRTPSPIGKSASSPLTTPKTPKAASKLGIPAEVAKTMLKYIHFRIKSIGEHDIRNNTIFYGKR
jgi:hypothetical protein